MSPTGTGSRSSRSTGRRAISPPSPDARAYCLDANLSYRVADALTLVGWDVSHVQALPGNTASPGQCNLSDERIARWCGQKHRVLVTIDSDFRGRWVTLGVLAKCKVETIVFTSDLAGVREQHQRLTAALPRWEATLGATPYGHQVWEQGPTGDPRPQSAPRGRRRR